METVQLPQRDPPGLAELSVLLRQMTRDESIVQKHTDRLRQIHRDDPTLASLTIAVLTALLREQQRMARLLEIELQTYLHNLLSAPLPPNWREQWHAYVAQLDAKGYTVEPASVQDFENWLEAYARQHGLLPGEHSTSHGRLDQVRGLEEAPPTAPVPALAAISGGLLGSEGPEPDKPGNTNPQRGNQKPYADAAEDLVSKSTEIPLNPRGKGAQKYPGRSKPDGSEKIYRYPDLKFRGRDGSVRLRGSIIEVKASSYKHFGDLSARSREQIEDAVAYVEKLRKKAGLIKDPAQRVLLENAHVEVFSDVKAPTRGKFQDLMRRQLLKWKEIPRPANLGDTPGSARPGLGAARDLALGLMISLIEADVANSYYRDSAHSLNDLLNQITRNDSIDESRWQMIAERLQEIADMKQPIARHAFEWISYGQGSLLANQASAIMVLALELAKEFGYQNVKTWTEFFDGRVGHFEKKSQ